MPKYIANLTVSSPDMESLARIPDRFSADGGNAVPTVSISGVGSDAVEIAFVLNDPDAPLPNGFTHWTLFNVPRDTTEISDSNFRDFTQGLNGMGEPVYSGPQPPQGHGVHHYYFWVYSLDTRVEGTHSRESFLEKYADNILEQNRFVATFSAE
jgi:Raf kinase inhibitor-like YbhB/YbcL family protein